MGLFSPGYASEDKEKAIAALMTISDEAKLEKILPKIRNNGAAEFAAGRITDPERIHRLVIESPNFFVRVTLVKKATDEAVLRKVAEEDPNEIVSCWALGKITDEDYLLDYIERFKKDSKRAFKAVQQLHTEKLLVKLMIGNDEDYIVKGCIRALNNVITFHGLHFLSSGRSIPARRYALKCAEQKRSGKPDNKTPENQLLDLLLTDPSESSRYGTLKTILDMDLVKPENCDALFAVAVEDDCRKNRELAFELLKRMQSRLDRTWWKVHIDDSVHDQRLSWLLRNSPFRQDAVLAIADLLIRLDEEKDKSELDCLYAHCNMCIISTLQQVAEAGNTDAAETLKKLLNSDKLDSRLLYYARKSGIRY